MRNLNVCLGFSNFFKFDFFGKGKAFFSKKVIFYKVGAIVFGDGESESNSHFSKFVNSRITLWDVNLVNNV